MSAAEAARRLGTTIPRVKRAIERLDLPVQRGRGGRVAIDAETFECLRDEFGTVTPLDGLTRVQTAVLAALDCAPFGLISGRAVAARAGVAPTSASRAIDQLMDQGLVERTATHVAAGRARRVDLLRARRSSPRWRKLAPALGCVDLPQRDRRTDDVVPPRLLHLFWNVAPKQLDVRSSGGSIARRLLQTGDPEGLAWGARNLSAADWEHGAAARGLDPRTGRLAENLAAAAQAPVR
ncbi:MAG TPA: MarR family transcriptional regulator [Conexibacter sp.]|nr:MarR family transcriptional regulator [Conexibacter sp.]